MNKTTYGRNGNSKLESASAAIAAESRWANEKFQSHVDVYEEKFSATGQKVLVWKASIKLGR
jgi:hypothetical protein